MRKFATFLFCGFLMMFMSGCKENLLNDSSDIISNFESDVYVEANNKKYEFKISHVPEGINIITFSKPEDIKGLTFSCEGDKYTISMKDLSGEFNKEPLMENSFVMCILKVLNSLSDKSNLKQLLNEEGEETFRGKSENIEYDVTINKKGEIIRIVIPEHNITANFKHA